MAKNKLIHEGKILLVILGILAGISFLSILASIGNAEKMLRSIISLLLTIFLSFLVYQGYKIAKWIMGVLLIFASLGGIVGASSVPSKLGGLFVMLFALFYGMMGLFLLSSARLKVFMQYQCKERLKGRKNSGVKRDSKLDWNKQLKR